eukprot:633350-Rhodomonas_salina.1
MLLPGGRGFDIVLASDVTYDKSGVRLHLWRRRCRMYGDSCELQGCNADIYSDNAAVLIIAVPFVVRMKEC